MKMSLHFKQKGRYQRLTKTIKGHDADLSDSNLAQHLKTLANGPVSKSH